MILVVGAVASQCDKVVVALNGYDHFPQELSRYSNVECHLLDNSLGDGAKFLTVADTQGYYLSLDDDLLAPPTFVEDLISGIDRYNGCVSFHGKTYKPPFRTFKKPTAVHRCLSGVSLDVQVDFIGSGCAGFHTDRLKLSIDMFKIPNMADVWLSQACTRQMIPMYALAHDRGYFTYLPPKGKTIWEMFSGATPVQDKIMRTFLK